MDAVEARQSPSSLCRADREVLERILPAVAGALGSEYFLASEAVASENAALVLVLAGMNARRLGKLLRRGDGVPVVATRPRERDGGRRGAVGGAARAVKTWSTLRKQTRKRR
jgi:hypothetical protein